MQIIFLPDALTIILCFLVWPVLQVGAALICMYMPDRYFSPDGFFFRARQFEKEGQLYNRIFRVSRWKHQYCNDPEHKVFAIRVCKSNEAKAVSFSKARNEQNGTLSCGNKNLHDILVLFIPDYQPKKRYKVTGEFDAENRVMYYDMTTAEVSEFRAVKE